MMNIRCVAFDVKAGCKYCNCYQNEYACTETRIVYGR